MTTKEKVLEILNQNKGNSVSGEKLAEACDVSRAAIWKAVNSLREKGCNIEGTTNGGYMLSGVADVFSTEAFTSAFEKSFPPSHIECFKEIDSTNTYAKKVLSEAGNLRNFDGSLTEAGKKYHRAVIVAECQTAGRGRLGRTFYSPSKTGIYLSVIYAPEGGITNPAKMTAFSAVAVCRAIKKLYGIEPKIKWINDIFINGKKVSGILTEGFTNFETGQIESAIIGIGINIADNPEVFPDEVKKVAGSITGSGKMMKEGTDPNAADDSVEAVTVSRCELAASVAGEVLNILEEDSESALNEYKQLSFIIGQTVEVHPVIGDDKANYMAKAVDIADDAGLVVELEDGSRKVLSSGEVSLRSVSFSD